MARSNSELKASPPGGPSEIVAPKKTATDTLIAKAAEIAALNLRNEQLVTTIRSMRDEIADLRAENGRLWLQLAKERGMPPQGPPDELTAQVDAQWRRCSEDYRMYRKAVGYRPGGRCRDGR